MKSISGLFGRCLRSRGLSRCRLRSGSLPAAPRLESLENRCLPSSQPAVLTVVPPSFPTDALHFHTLQDALAAAVVAHDTVQIEPGAAAGSFNDAALAANAAAGDTTITTDNPISATQIVSVGTERVLIDAVGPAAGSLFQLTLHNPLANAHAAGTPITNQDTLGIANTVTIQGDSNAAPANVPSLEVWSGTTQVTLLNLNVSRLALDTNTSGTQVIDSILNFVRENGGGTGNGNNLITGNLTTANGFVTLTGNTPGGAATADRIVSNRFTGGARMLLENDDGTLVQGNTFDGQPFNGVAVSVDDSQHVTVAQNHFSLAGGSQDKAIRVEFVATATSAVIRNNVAATNGLGTGLFLNVGNGAQFEARVQGNDFRGNVLGVDIFGDGSSAGAVDLGGGSAGDLGSSVGGNNFRGFTASATANGVFAIYLHNTGANATVLAQNNIWSAADPNTVVKDGTHNTNTGGGNPGTGLIDVGATQLTADQQFIQTLYNQFLGRSGSVGELNLWVGALPNIGKTGVANAFLHSPETLKTLVDNFYLQYLNRPADPAGEAAWVNVLQHGGTAEQVIIGFLSSPEYYNHATALSGSPHPDANFIQSLYQQLLARPGSAVEIEGWLTQLPALGRSGVAAGILNSAEARTDLVLELYTTLLHRQGRPAAAEIAAWVNSSLDLLSLEVQFAGSQEFYLNG